MADQFEVHPPTRAITGLATRLLLSLELDVRFPLHLLRTETAHLLEIDPYELSGKPSSAESY